MDWNKYAGRPNKSILRRFKVAIPRALSEVTNTTEKRFRPTTKPVMVNGATSSKLGASLTGTSTDPPVKSMALENMANGKGGSPSKDPQLLYLCPSKVTDAEKKSVVSRKKPFAMLRTSPGKHGEHG